MKTFISAIAFWCLLAISAHAGGHAPGGLIDRHCRFEGDHEDAKKCLTILPRLKNTLHSVVYLYVSHIYKSAGDLALLWQI